MPNKRVKLSMLSAAHHRIKCTLGVALAVVVRRDYVTIFRRQACFV